KAAWRAFFCAHTMVLSEAPSAFWRKRRLPLSSTMQMVTSTFCFLASASAAATIVLMAARLMYFLDGRSAAKAVATKASVTKSSLIMGRMLPLGARICQMKCEGGAFVRREGRNIFLRQKSEYEKA